jgi:flagellar protein FlaG
MDMDMSVKLNLSYPAHKTAAGTAENVVQKPQADSVAAVAESKDSDQEKLKVAVQQIEKFVQSVRRNLEFSIDETSGQVVVKVIASESGEVVRQIPSEEALKLASSLKDVSSLLFSAKA